MKNSVKLLIVILLFCGLVINGYAWNRRGHFTVAAIAYRQLEKDDPARLKKLLSILGSHPAFKDWKKEYDSAQVDSRPESFEAYVFMRAAAWPDDVRDPENNPEHHPSWHFVNYSLSLPAAVNFTIPPQQENIFSAMKLSVEELKNTSIDNTEKARKISWMLHLVGDIHQPLHTVALKNNTFSNGDQGGNLECIHPDKDHAFKLHSFWDGLLGANPDEVVPDAKQAWIMAGNLMQNIADITPAQFNVSPNAVSWSKESAEIALKSAYQFHNSPVEMRATVPVTFPNGEKGKGCPSVQNWNPLPDDYEKDAKNIAARRVLTGGYRLANALEKIKIG